ncbi:MAG: hypothetical protein R6U21_08060 [Thermoplasmatota archaeon]
MKGKNVKTCFIGVFVAVFLISPTMIPLTADPISTERSSVGSVTVYDLLSKDMEKQSINRQELETLLTIINEPLELDSYEEQIQTKLSILVSLDIISDESAEVAYQCFQHKKTLTVDEVDSLQSQPIFFDTLNLFNGIFFGMKGEMQNTFLYLPVFQFPFFDDNITALFVGYAKTVGSGSVFTLGTLGFKYIYDFDKDAYDFPHFSPLTGNLIGFTGILIEVSVGEVLPVEYQGTYLIGVGMSIFTLWNKES